MTKKFDRTIAVNRKALHDYNILKSFEAGIVLKGTEVKSIRLGNVNLKNSWCTISNGEIFVRDIHISPYNQGNIFNLDPLRIRKLLLHKLEIINLLSELKIKGNTIIPISLYYKNSKIKLNIALCKGRKDYDKRQLLIKKVHRNEMKNFYD